MLKVNDSLELCHDRPCPIEFVVNLLGNKWSILVLRELFSGTKRTHELLTALPGISTKTLTIRLRELEQHGLVERQVYAEIPPHVDYTLTAKGQQLQPVMSALHTVGTQWLGQDFCFCPLTQSNLAVATPATLNEDRLEDHSSVIVPR